MKCRKCRKEIPDDAEFCYHCGYEVIAEEKQPEPQPKSGLPVKAICAGIIGIVILAIIVWQLVK